MKDAVSEGHGGPRKGAGRKPFEVETSYVRVRLTKRQHRTLMKLGGSPFLQKLLDEKAAELDGKPNRE